VTMKNYFDDILSMSRMKRQSLNFAIIRGRIKGVKMFPEHKRPYYFVDEEGFQDFKNNYKVRVRFPHYEGSLPNKVFTPVEAVKKQLPIGSGLKCRFNESNSEIVVNLIELIKFVDYLNPDIIIDRGEVTTMEFIPGEPDITQDEEDEE
jgi:hypothetical protein